MKTKEQIVADLLEKKAITAEDAATLLTVPYGTAFIPHYYPVPVYPYYGSPWSINAPFITYSTGTASTGENTVTTYSTMN